MGHRYYAYQEKKLHEMYLSEVSDSQQNRMKSYLNMRKKTHFINIDSDVDCFTVCRGIICGIVAVSINPAAYNPITAVLTGIVAGGIYIFSLSISASSGVDDSLHVSQVHGLMSLISLFSICFFHKDEGFFFRDIYSEF